MTWAHWSYGLLVTANRKAKLLPFNSIQQMISDPMVLGTVLCSGYQKKIKPSMSPDFMEITVYWKRRKMNKHTKYIALRFDRFQEGKEEAGSRMSV